MNKAADQTAPRDHHPESGASGPLAIQTKGEPEAHATFVAFNQFAEIDVARRRLPHWEQDGTTYFVTFRLADSLPREKLNQLEDERARWMAAHPKPWSDAAERIYCDRFSARVEEWLDAGYGGCLLRNPKAAEIVATSLKHFQGQRYELGAWVVMPNHVHAVVRPFKPHALGQILHTWKSYSAHQINALLGRSGALWQHESFDHIVRNEAACDAISEYIERNPDSAGIKVALAAASDLVKTQAGGSRHNE